MCLSDPHCCVASYSKGASTCRFDTSERCCVGTETLDEWRFIQRKSYHTCNITLTEVAYDKPAEQSSVYSLSYSAAKAIDGSVNTYMHTNKEQSPYWIVDLGKIYQIKRIEIFNRNAGFNSTGERLRDLDIIVGPSHNEMQICAHYVGPAQLGDHLLFTCGHVECARYVKLRLTGTDYLHVAEVKVYAVNESCTSN
ncbi:fucolectin-6-like [Mytilus edulis]|uniref:fucolectin-6-like n=1 Tax=Mytilus edulis TaxID=6550 RepID=UPI0039EE3445